MILCLLGTFFARKRSFLWVATLTSNATVFFGLKGLVYQTTTYHIYKQVLTRIHIQVTSNSNVSYGSIILP